MGLLVIKTGLVEAEQSREWRFGEKLTSARLFEFRWIYLFSPRTTRNELWDCI